MVFLLFFFFQAEDGIRDLYVTGVQTCALPIWPDAIVMRHAASGAPHFLARHLPTPIINAGDGTHEHPTQALLDARTILDRRERLEGLKVAIIGDIAHSRVARSNVHLLSKFGADIVLCGPATVLPAELAQMAAGVSLTND